MHPDPRHIPQNTSCNQVAKQATHACLFVDARFIHVFGEVQYTQFLVAQMVEHGANNAGVVSSILIRETNFVLFLSILE
jgi:hypothetical protein